MFRLGTHMRSSAFFHGSCTRGCQLPSFTKKLPRKIRKAPIVRSDLSSGWQGSRRFLQLKPKLCYVLVNRQCSIFERQSRSWRREGIWHMCFNLGGARSGSQLRGAAIR